MTVVPKEAGFFSDKGPHRQRNEDVALTNLTDGVFIVADGLGGAAAGDRASRVATDTLSTGLTHQGSPKDVLERILPEDETRSALEDMVVGDRSLAEADSRLRFAFLVAHCAVLSEARQTGSIGMATALVVAWQAPDAFWIGHVGDCRAYALNGDSFSLLTRDHSLSKALEGRTTLPKGVAESAFLRSRLTQVIGGECAPTPDLKEWHPEPGTSLLLCSDGVWGSLSEDELNHRLRPDNSCEEVCQELVETAIRAGSRDNATALVVRY